MWQAGLPKRRRHSIPLLEPLLLRRPSGASVHDRILLRELDAKDVLKSMRRSIYNIQKQLNKRLSMRPIPRIIFVREKAVREASHIEEFLEQVKDEKTD